MNLGAKVTQKQLMELLLNVAIIRPVFIWDPWNRKPFRTKVMERRRYHHPKSPGKIVEIPHIMCF